MPISGIFCSKPEILVNKLERIKKKAVNGTKAAVEVVKHYGETGEMQVSSEERADRIRICEGDADHERCPEYEKYVPDECGNCLCYIKALKAGLAAMYCPLYKWPGDELKAPDPYEDI